MGAGIKDLGAVAGQLGDYAKMLEGPLPLRGAAALSGAALIGGTIYSLVDLTEELEDPCEFLMKAYILLFAGIVIVNELKASTSDVLIQVHMFFQKWFPYLNVCAGKGLHLIFTGSLGLAFHDNLYVFVPAAVMVLAGVVYTCIHFGKCKQFDEAYDETMQAQSQAYV